MKKNPTLSLKQARSFIVSNQLLSGKENYSGEKGTRKVVEHLGYIQIDTISVIARAHHHVLSTRVSDYVPELLENIEQQRHVFEYWAHAASYLPMKDFRFSLFHMEKIKAGKGHWRKRDKKWMKWAYDQVKAEGPKMGRDFKKDKSLSYHHAWGGHPVNQALRQLFMEGELMVTGRKGFQKVFDLKERILPDHVDTRLPSEQEYYKHLILRDLKANGLMKSREVGHLITIPKSNLEQLINELVEEKVLTEVSIKGLETSTYYAIQKDLAAFETSRSKKQMKILSPFDNLVIQRKRMRELFDFEYTLECYVTAAKRKVGYFSLPLLFGTDFVGQIDLKVDRKAEVLVVKNLVWEEGQVKNKEKLFPILKKALADFQGFNGCLEIEGLNSFK
ncbi:MAG: hypothetical protein ACI8YQ_000207 [Polaribacter sp.]